MAAGKLPDFDKLWNYEKPAETEARFRALLPKAEKSGDQEYYLQLLTQLARTQSLQRKFPEAHKILDGMKPKLGAAAAGPTMTAASSKRRSACSRRRSVITKRRAGKKPCA